MMKKSAGILLFKKQNNDLLLLLVHPGGPLWANKDLEAWSIPKGEFTDEQPLEAAKREFYEETGKSVSGKFIELNTVTLKSGKKVYAWALESDFDTSALISNTFGMEWPPNSGLYKSFPEIDKAEWFSVKEALEKINPGQRDLISQLTLITSKYN